MPRLSTPPTGFVMPLRSPRQSPKPYRRRFIQRCGHPGRVFQRKRADPAILRQAWVSEMASDMREALLAAFGDALNFGRTQQPEPEPEPEPEPATNRSPGT